MKKTKLTIVVAVAKNGVIGANGAIPWDCRGDMKHFQATTTGGIVVFGHNTYATLPRRPLPNRTNVVISQTLPVGVNDDGTIVFRSLNDVLVHFANAPEIFICGGAYLYKTTLPIVDKLIWTTIDAEPDGDTCFPEINWDEWTNILREPHDGFTITEWERKR